MLTRVKGCIHSCYSQMIHFHYLNALPVHSRLVSPVNSERESERERERERERELREREKARERESEGGGQRERINSIEIKRTHFLTTQYARRHAGDVLPQVDGVPAMQEA
jgi:hypothetical protein